MLKIALKPFAACTYMTQMKLHVKKSALTPFPLPSYYAKTAENPAPEKFMN
jgi:hypothetical protein